MVKRLVWILFAFICTWSFLSPLQVQAEWQYGSSPNDYDFGWLASGVSAPGSEPYCTTCVNALTYNPNYNRSIDQSIQNHDASWNLTVAMFRCDGVQNNELWAYHEPTSTIVFNNLTEILCVDAASWKTEGVLKLRDCNSSSTTQRWQKEGNRLISGIKASNGDPLFMMGGIPNKEINPANRIYEYFLNLTSSVPSDTNTGFTYPSNYTFLSRKNLINTSTNAFTAEGMLMIKSSPQNISQIVNGGFESSTIQSGTDIYWSDWNPKVPSYFALCGWVIYGAIDYVKSGFLQSHEGVYCVHLNTNSDKPYASTISQAFQTKVGTEYLLSFAFNGFPPGLQVPNRPTWSCSPTYNQARIQVRVISLASTNIATGKPSSSDASGVLQNFSLDISNSNSVGFGSLWQSQTLTFRPSTNATVISFISLNVNNSCGPLIDAVTVIVSRPDSHRKTAVTWGVVGSVVGLVIVSAAVLGFVYRKRCSGDDEDYSGLYKTENARVFSAKELSSSTNKFSAVLGEGAFGTVYKADFPDGTVGAVKVEKPKGLLSSSKILASAEIAVLLRVHHRNLVNLIGFCIHKGRHMLVFEYLPNGTLFERLHQSILPSCSPGVSTDSVEQLRNSQAYALPWQKRVKIASDVAYGLEYLHHDADPPIVHRDVKSQNILLTATDSAKLADFGLSKSAPPEATTFQSVETMVRGSIGYLDPQYFLTGVFSAKSDVYSYGVVLLELISGHQAIYNAASLASWAAPYLTSPNLYHELVDKNLDGQFDATELESLIELSKMCMLDDGKNRPTMRQVVAFLHSRQLVTGPTESSEQVGDTLLRETWHKMHPLFIDFESVPTSSGSGEHFVPSSPQPRD